MCVHKRNMGCTYPYIPQCTRCAETIHRVPYLDIPLFHVRTWVTPPYFLNAAFAKICIRNILFKSWKKTLILKKSNLTNTTGLILKRSSSFGMKLKRGINITIFACQQISMSIESRLSRFHWFLRYQKAQEKWQFSRRHIMMA